MRNATTTILALSILSLPGCEELTGTSDETTTTVEVPEGFTLGRQLRTGSEARLIGEYGLVADIGDYDVVDTALSRDGEVVWYTLYYEWDDPKYRVMSMRTDGSEFHEYDIVRPPDAPFAPQLFQIEVDADGSTALLTQYTYGADGVEAEFSIAERGEAFSVVAHSPSAIDPLGLAENVEARITADGDAFLFHTGRWIFRSNASDGWVPFVIDQAENITWDGEPLAWNAHYRGFDITANGGAYITTIGVAVQTSAVITGTGIGVTTFETGFDVSAYSTAEIDDAGETISYTLIDSPIQSFVGEQGGLVENVEPPVGFVRKVALANSGIAFHGSVDANGTSGPFIQYVGESQRIMSLSPNWITWGSVPEIDGHLSDDAMTYAVSSIDGLVMHRDRFAWETRIEHVFWKLEDDTLTIQAIAHGADIGAVTVRPLVHGYLPAKLQYGYGEDPMNADRLGLDLELMEGTTDTFEGVFHLNPDATVPLDDFSFRIYVADSHPVNSGWSTTTGFMDFDLFE